MKPGPSRWPAPGVSVPGFPWQEGHTELENPAQAGCVATWAALVADLDRRRTDQGLSIRKLANASQVSTSRIEALLRGRAWGQWPTLAACAHTVGTRVVLATTTTPAKLTAKGRSLAGPDRIGPEQTAGNDPDLLAAAWHNAGIGTLRWYIRAAGHTGVTLTRRLGIRQATWSTAQPGAPGHWVSIPVTLAVARVIPLRLTLQDRERAWPLMAWETRNYRE